MSSLVDSLSISQQICSNTTEQRLDCVADALQSDIISLALGLNAFFVIFGGVLVFLMQAGFAMICAGCVREKNIQNTLLKNLLDACGAALAFWSIGYAIAYGSRSTSGTTFIGTTNFLLINLHDYAFWFFEFAFAATTTTIVAGTLAERSQMVAYFLYSVLLTAFVYPVVVHAIWSNHGFLSPKNPDALLGSGAIDFAGSGVVHVTGGMCALIAVSILGPRTGRFYDATGKVIANPTRVKGSSVSLQMLGTFLLWFGWYGFNCGSAFIIDNPIASNVVALVAANTTLSGAAACISALFLSAILNERRTGEYTFDVTYAMNGALCGLVSITAGCAVVETWAAVVIGFVGGILYIMTTERLVRWKIDDAVDAIPVHLPGGIWGVLATGLFASSGRMIAAYGHAKHIGWFYSFNRSADATLLLCQVIELLFIIGWVTVTMTPFFLILNYAGYFRSDPLEEVVGLDISYHEAKAYREVLMGGKFNISNHGSSCHDDESLTVHNNVTADTRMPDERHPNAM